MLKYLKGLFRTEPQQPVAEFDAELAPDDKFFAIGDIHGCFGAFETLLRKIETEDPEARVICVGDYIDRGDQSADVLRAVMQRNLSDPDRFICLMGNHEEMLLKFLDDPQQAGESWLRYGGLQTLASFRVSHSGGPGANIAETRDRLVAAMGPELIEWLKGLPVQWQSGNVAVVHAAADPETPLNYQSRDVLLWGHPAYGQVARTDGNWVVNGHVIVDAPQVFNGCIGVDTGAFATGVLTAAYVAPGSVSFLKSR